MVRCALLDASADELLAWLRTPGVLRTPAFADRLESRARREGARTAAEARALWEQERWSLEALDHMAQAYARGGVKALAERVDAEAADAVRRALAADRAGLRRRGRARRARRRARSRARAARARAELPIARCSPSPPRWSRRSTAWRSASARSRAPGRVTVTEPQSLRARRVRALFACGLQEGVFPAPTEPEPFLGDDERRAINAASGLRLRLHEDALHVERYLFYAAVSRPTDLLALSWHAAGDDGAPVGPLAASSTTSPTCCTEGWAEHPRRRELGAAGWPCGRRADRARGRALRGRAPRHRAPPIAPLADLRAPAALAAARAPHLVGVGARGLGVAAR